MQNHKIQNILVFSSVMLSVCRSSYLLHREEVVASPCMEVFKAKLVYPGLVEGVPAYGRRLELDDFKGPFQPKPLDSMNMQGTKMIKLENV